PRSPTTTSSEALMARTKAPRITGAVALSVVAVVATACSSQSTRLPLTRAAGADSVAQQDVASTDAPAPAPVASLGPLDHQLVPDVLVRLAAPLQSTETQHLVGLVPPGGAVMLRTGKLAVAAPTGSGEISAAGVDPAAFRRFTPKNTAEVTGVWDNVAKGYIALSYDAAKRLGVSLGNKVT